MHYCSWRAVATSAGMRAVIAAYSLLVSLTISANELATLDGQSLAFETARGNCLACHQIPGGEQMGDIGPPLHSMVERFPERDRLFQQIWDAGVFNVQTLMPPYGRQEILSVEEIHAIIDFLYTK